MSDDSYWSDSNANDDVLLDEDNSNSNEDVQIFAENKADEFGQPDQDNEEIGETISTCGRISRLFYYECHFPETANFQEGNQDEKGRWMRPCYFDD